MAIGGNFIGRRSVRQQFIDIAAAQQAQRRQEQILAGIAAGPERDRTLDSPLPNFPAFQPGGNFPGSAGGTAVPTQPTPSPARQAGVPTASDVSFGQSFTPQTASRGSAPLPFNPPPSGTPRRRGGGGSDLRGFLRNQSASRLV
jgi:hypothetical protein